MPNRVPDEGKKSARIVLIGEAPGENEDAARRPFVGASGSTLTSWWKIAGLQRSDFYITNVSPFRPKGNKIETIDALDMARYTEELHARIALLEDPYLLVPTGNTALRALTGKTGILKHRGSIYAYTDRNGRVIKCIPTIHPAATYREPSLARRCIYDWCRIAGDAQFRSLRLPVREHYTEPDIDDLRVYLEDCRSQAESLALDIETPGGHLTCIGFSYDPAFSITIPTTLKYWGSQLPEAIWLIRSLLELDVAKVMQNGLFDSYYLAWLGFVVNNWQWDTLAMHHALCPNDSHDLAYMASVDTREPYWKDEAKDPDEMRKYASNDKAFWVYNGKDVAVTQELKGVYYGSLSKCHGDTGGAGDSMVGGRGSGRLPFYYTHYRDMFEPLLSMSLGGIRIAEDERTALAVSLECECRGILESLSEIAGGPLHAKTGLSPIKLRRFMYETLGLPVQKKRGTGTVTTDETAIRSLMRRYPKFEEGGNLILNFRRKSKLAQFLADGIADEDGRVRCQYRFTTETGRLSSSSNPRGTGTNLQNQDHEVLHLYLPNEGQVLMGLDLSQAEDRWVKVIAYANRHLTEAVVQRYEREVALLEEQMVRYGPSEKLVRPHRHAGRMILALSRCDWEEVLWRARAKPWENDEHWRAAEAIYGLPRSEMDKALHRQLGKRTRHALNYDMHATRHAEECAKVGLSLGVDEAADMLEALLVVDPYIAIYQWSRRSEVMKNRMLEDTWGYRYYFTYDRLDDEAYRRGYAFQPQAEVAHTTNQQGIIVGHRYIKEHGLRSQLLAQKHDEVLFSVDKSEAWELYSTVRQSLEQPRTYRGVELSVPADLFIGRNWGEKIEFKTPPTREELEARIEGLL